MNKLDLNWPETTLFAIIIVFAVAAFRPEVLDIVARFFSQVGHLLSYLKVW